MSWSSIGVPSVPNLPKNIVGLDRVTNPQDAVEGIALESRKDFAERVRKSVAKNSKGTPESVYANVSDLVGVSDCYVIDNPKGVPVTVGASQRSIKPHSIYVAVIGGRDEEIAKAILTYAGNGCDFNGNTTVSGCEKWLVKINLPNSLKKSGKI